LEHPYNPNSASKINDKPPWSIITVHFSLNLKVKYNNTQAAIKPISLRRRELISQFSMTIDSSLKNAEFIDGTAAFFIKDSIIQVYLANFSDIISLSGSSVLQMELGKSRFDPSNHNKILSQTSYI